MNATLELIKAKQNAIQAEADLKQAKENADREARIRTFAPLREMLKEVIDLPAKNFGYTERRSVRDHIDLHGRNESLDQSVNFWQLHFGNHGLVICAKEDGTFKVNNGHTYLGDRFTLEQAKEKLIEHLALIIK